MAIEQEEDRVTTMRTYFDVEACFGTCFNEHHAELPRFCIAFLNGDLPACHQ